MKRCLEIHHKISETFKASIHDFFSFFLFSFFHLFYLLYLNVLLRRLRMLLQVKCAVTIRTIRWTLGGQRGQPFWRSIAGEMGEALS